MKKEYCPHCNGITHLKVTIPKKHFIERMLGFTILGYYIFLMIIMIIR